MLGKDHGHLDIVTDLALFAFKQCHSNKERQQMFASTLEGALALSNMNSSESDSKIVRRKKQFPPEQSATKSQSLLYQNSGVYLVSYDMVTQFGLCPVDFLQVI